MPAHPQVRVRDALIGAVINAAINGAIAHATFGPLGTVPLAQGGLPLGQVSVWGQSLGVVLGLALLMTLLTAPLFVRSVRQQDPALAARMRPGFPRLLGLALRHMAWACAVVWGAGALWNALGPNGVAVSAQSASLAVALVAGAAAYWVDLRTKRALLLA